MKKRVRIYKKPCYECGGQTHMKSGGEFEPHMMYDPKTGKGYPAESMEDHLAMKEKGFLHKDEMPKKQFGGNQFSKRLGKELKSSYKPFSSTAPQNQNTDEVVGERKNVFVSSLSNNAFKKYAEEEQQSLQELHQQMKMGGNTSYGMYDQYGGQYPTDEYMPKMEDGGDTEESGLDPTDPYYVENLIERYADKFGTTAVKGFGDYEEGSNIHPLEQYANSGEAQRAAVIGYMEAMIKGDNRTLMKAAKILDATDLPEVSWDVLPYSDEDKLEDMAALAREEARGNIYDKVMIQVDEIDRDFESKSAELEKELRKKIASGKLTAEEQARVTENLEKLKRIKGIVAKDKRNEVVRYHLKGQIDWDKNNWGQAYVDYLDMYNNTFGEKKDGKWVNKPLKYDLLENISDDLRNSKQSSGSFFTPDTPIPFDKTKFINDDKDTHEQTDIYLSADKVLDDVTINSGKQKTQQQNFSDEENAAAAKAKAEAEAKAKAEAEAKAAAEAEAKAAQEAAAAQQQPKVVQPKPVQKKPAPTYKPNVVTSKPSNNSALTPAQKAAILKMRGVKKYGGNINTYQDGGQPEDYMNTPGNAYQFGNIYSNDELRERLNDRFMQASSQDIQAEEQPEMFPAFENLNWRDRQTSGFDKYQEGREVFAPFRNLTWNMKQGVNDMFANPNKDYGYSTADGVQIRMNRKGDEKIDLAGTYANAFRQDPLGTVGRTLGKTAEIGARAAKNISRMREDNMYDAFNQKRKMADNQFSPVDNPLSRGNWTTNQGYFNPDLMTMQPWFTGQNYQYGGDVVEMTDMEIEEFLRAGGQIEYLD